MGNQGRSWLNWVRAPMPVARSAAAAIKVRTATTGQGDAIATMINRTTTPNRIAGCSRPRQVGRAGAGPYAADGITRCPSRPRAQRSARRSRRRP
jgi:hypothetical protein